MSRKKIIAGNWKMNMTPSEAVALVNELKPLVVNEDVDVVFCVPAIDIIPAMEAAKGTNIYIGAENMYYEEKGTHSAITCCNLQSCQSQALRKRRLPVLHRYPAVRKAPERRMRIQSRRTGYGLPQL